MSPTRDPLSRMARRQRGESFARALCRHPFVSVALPFAAGIALAGRAAPFAHATALSIVAAAGAILCAARRRFVVSVVLATGAFLLLGVARHGDELREGAVVAGLVPDGASRVVRVRARVRRVPLPSHPEDLAPRPQAHVVDLLAACEGARWRDVGGGVSLTLASRAPDILPGDEVELLATVRRPRPARYPNGYDLRRALATDGVYFVAHAPGGSLRVTRRGGELGIRRIAARIRRRLASALRARLPRREAEVCVAILLGHRPGVDAADRARFTSSGLGHVLAVSGLHVAILVGIAGWALRGLGVPARAVAAVAAALAVLYALVAGARPPVVRSAVMVVTYLAARVLRRDRDAPNAVAFAAFAILMYQPLSLFDAGFQLSFAAVTFLAFLFPVLEEVWATLRGAPERWMDPVEQTARSRAGAKARQALFASAAAWLGVQPLLVHYIGVFNPWGILSNVVMLPLVTLALATSFAFAVASAVLGGVGWLLLPAARASLTGLLLGVEAFSRLPMSALWLASPGEAWLIGYYAVSFVLFAYAQGSRTPVIRATHVSAALWARRVLVCVSGALAVSALAWWAISASGARRPPSPSLTVLDYGSERAAIVRDAGGAFILLNAGSPGRNVRLVQSVSGMADEELQAVVVTRDEPTHAAGLLELARSCRVRALLLHAGRGRGRSEELLACARRVRRTGGLVLNCSPGDELADRRHGTTLSWHDVAQGSRRVREAALVSCEAGTFRVALLDCDRFASRARGSVRVGDPALDAGGVLVVIAGSASARIAEAVVDAMKPELVVMCASRVETAFSGPSAALDALRRSGARVVVTAGTGSIRVVRRDDEYVALAFDGARWREMDLAAGARGEISRSVGCATSGGRR